MMKVNATRTMQERIMVDIDPKEVVHQILCDMLTSIKAIDGLTDSTASYIDNGNWILEEESYHGSDYTKRVAVASIDAIQKWNEVNKSFRQIMLFLKEGKI